jgi:mono/diheme cytochrome c family protein
MTPCARVGTSVAGATFIVAIFAAAGAFSARAAEEKTEAGRTVFTKIANPQCGLCHTLQDAGTSGTIGANLEELKPDANRVAEAVRKGVGVMPSYAGKLTEEQIKAVAEYVSRAAAGK